MAQSQLEVVISARDQFSATANRVIGTMGRMQAAAGRVGKGVGQVGAGLLRIGTFAAVAAAGGLVAAAKAGGDFEAQLRTINTVGRLNEEELRKVGDGIRSLAREGRGDLGDLTAAYYDLLSAGIAVKDAQGVLDAATRLAIGGLSTNAEAVDLLTTAINAYGQSSSEALRDADLFAKAIEIGKVKANEIAASFANVAPIAAQVGINIEEIAAAYGALTAQGTPAAEVATQMQRAIVELLTPGKELRALQKDLNVSFLKMAQDKGLVVALQAMRDAVKGDDAAFKALFGRVEGYKFALQTTGPQQKIYNAALKQMGESAGTATEQMGERTQGLNFQMSRLKANLIDAALTLSAGFLPALARAADRLSKALGRADFRDELHRLGEDIGRTIDSIDWDKILAGAREMWSIAKQILAVIARIPPEIIAATVAFGGLNKLSGGLLGAGIGNIGMGLAGGIANGIARGMASAGIGKLFVQPVFVTNPGFGLGGPGGGLGDAVTKGGLLAALARLIPVAAGIALFDQIGGFIRDTFAPGMSKGVRDGEFVWGGTGGTDVRNTLDDIRDRLGGAPGAFRALDELSPIRALLASGKMRVEARSLEDIAKSLRIAQKPPKFGDISSSGTGKDPFGLLHLKSFATGGVSKSILKGELVGHIAQVEKAIEQALAKGDTETAAKLQATKAGLEFLLGQVKENTFRAGERAYQGALDAAARVVAELAKIPTAIEQSRLGGAPGAYRPSVTVNVSATSVTNTSNATGSYGTTSSSYYGGAPGAYRP